MPHHVNIASVPALLEQIHLVGVSQRVRRRANRASRLR
jgi:hypothetical protein